MNDGAIYPVITDHRPFEEVPPHIAKAVGKIMAAIKECIEAEPDEHKFSTTFNLLVNCTANLICDNSGGPEEALSYVAQVQGALKQSVVGNMIPQDATKQ